MTHEAADPSVGPDREGRFWSIVFPKMNASDTQQSSTHRADPDAVALARVRRSIDESIAVKKALAEQMGEAIVRVAQLVGECFRSGHKVLLFGNGGSASDAQHIAAEWTGRYMEDRPALPAIALTANTSELTAIGNDYGFDRSFSRLIEAHGVGGDVAIAISTSGNSPNILAAVETARERGLISVGLVGKGGGKLAPAVDHAITVPSDVTPRIQESHIAIGHIVCELVEAALFPELESS